MVLVLNKSYVVMSNWSFFKKNIYESKKLFFVCIIQTHGQNILKNRVLYRKITR